MRFHSCLRAAFVVAFSGLVLAQGPAKDEPQETTNGKPIYPNPVVPFLPNLSFLVGGSDSCSTPDVISGVGPHTFDNTAATTGAEGQTETPCNYAGQIGIQRDVWFLWTATTTGSVELQTCGGTTMDSKVAIYNGAGCPSAGAAIACNDDACGLQTRVLFPVVSGSQYLIQLGRFPTTTGAGAIGTFQFVDANPPVNDSCSAQAPISGPGPFMFNTFYATTGTEGQSEAPCLSGGSTGIARDTWYSWTAGFTGTAGVRTCSTTTLDTKIAVYPAGGCPVAGSALACNDDACGPQSSATFACTSGTTYVIQLGQDSNSTTAGGSGTFSVVDVSPSANDDCATPLAISGSGPFAFDTSFATTGTQGQTESSCLFAGTTGIGSDLWFTWTPTGNGTATLTMCTTAGGTDTKAAVYGGSGCPTTAALACDDDACNPGLETTLTFPVVCGSVYTIQLGKYPTTASVPSGTFSLSVAGGSTCAPAPVPYCFGDGSSTACPCGNTGATGNGCASSVNANGANIAATGTSSLSADTLVLAGTGMPNGTCLYFQGVTQIATAFGDGLRCVGGTIRRLGTKTNMSGTSQYPAAGDPSVSVKGGVTVPGTRTYQVWYRNAASFCTPATFNLSNGVLVTWF